MRLAQGIRMGAWILVGLNLLMALATIGILMRMAPAIAGILDRNGRSVHAGEKMLVALALAEHKGGQQELFMAALKRAEDNVTEQGEQDVLARIAQSASDAFAGDGAARQEVVENIVRLGDINREAMRLADSRARQFGEAGVWGVVFMAICVFIAGLLFVKNLLRRVIKPMVELAAVIFAYRNGNTLRRCSGSNMPQDVRVIFSGINEVLDQAQVKALAQKDFSKE